jgi:Leucine rich repeat
MEAKRKRRWFQFSLRTLMIFMLACAIGSAWVARKIERKRKELAAVRAIIKMGGGVSYDYEFASGKLIPGGDAPGPGWLRQLLGENFFAEVQSVFFLGRTNINDTGLQNVEALPQVQMLFLGSANVTDVGLAHLNGLNHLQYIELEQTNLTDAGLVNLKGLAELQTLHLDSTQVTDKGLANLKALSNLQAVFLRRTKVTDAGVKDLQTALPKCRIEH